MSKSKILAIDDDKNILEIIKLYLTKEGYEVYTATGGKSGLDAFIACSPDLVILDLMLPEMDGYEVCRDIRKMAQTPVIMLTAKGETFDKVLGLELGADDYMVKPFDPRELTARIKAILRRTNGSSADAEANRQLSFDGLTIDMDTYSAQYKGAKLDMPPKEFDLLFYLASHPNKVFTRDQLLENVWGYDYYGDSRTVDVHIKRLRNRFSEDDPWGIKTVWGVGYKFEVKN